jgi:carbonic anhydrase/acetyltransferase-like protein (isoleucine patch superfamily)
MAIYALGDLVPQIHPDAYVHPDATVIGNAVIGARSSIWPQAVLRADHGLIQIGEDTSIQDGCVLHTTPMHPTMVGSRCVVGHLVHLEGCTIEDDALVGNGSIVLHRAVVSSHSLVGSNAVVTNDMVVPSGAMALGVPAKIREGMVATGSFDLAWQSYSANGAHFRQHLRRID